MVAKREPPNPFFKGCLVAVTIMITLYTAAALLWLLDWSLT